MQVNKTKAVDGFVLSDKYVPDSSTLAGDIVGAVGIVGARSANFASSMSLADIVNVGVTAIAAHRGDHLMGMPVTPAGVAIQAAPSNFLSAAALSGGWALTGVVGLSIYIIGNLYVTLHRRLEAHHNAVVSLYKCYGMLLRIENFLKAAEVYCKTYDFQIDSIEIQDDLLNVFRILDEITTQDDIRKVYTNVKEGRTFTLNSAGPNHDQVIASPTQGSPFKSFFTNRGRAIWNSTGAVIHKLMTNVTEWYNRFNGIMIELNMHFTLLTSEFFMLANIYQMRSPRDKNEGFAHMMMNEVTIGDKQNPLWCIKVQIMLAPFLRVRNILFSCALSTNTELCRLTANKEMQAIDEANGWTRKALGAYFKRLFRLYTIEEAKTIDIDLFLNILRNAVKDVENNCYFRSLDSTEVTRTIVHDISTLLANPNISKDHALFMKVLNRLDEIYKIVLACGRTNQNNFMDLTRQFHSDHFTNSRMHYTETEHALTLEAMAHIQLRDFSYTEDLFSNIDEVGRIVTGMCEAISSNASALDKRSYDVGAHSTESESTIANRLRKMNRPVITTNAAAAAIAAAAADAAVGYIPVLMNFQMAYNALYKFVMEFDPKSKEKSILEKRGRWLAGCILLIERANVGAVVLSKKDITTICEKCKALIAIIKTHDPTRSLNQIVLLFDRDIPNSIRQMVDISIGVKGADSESVASGEANMSPQQVSIADAARAVQQQQQPLLQPSQVSQLQLPQLPPPQLQQPQPPPSGIRKRLTAFGKTIKAQFGRKSPEGASLLGHADADAGGGRNLQKTRRMRHNRNHKCSKRLRAHCRLNRNRNRSRIYTRRRR
jgi:hypothetical protein